ncbi:CRISPR-associated endonuclease Cas1 [Oculatella sp. FACHB-28]|uniref:CRISPR-associated endonuclease Cas1 n=1 Tax=Oculatella sp. FACHB-28 TaxID=2692845 RepID=UPI00168A1A50|nr:CRISPR-associated endonuclease Cas1 [Oculatella sp. FACHB-28]MBD2054635.1 CRISPR-associated endonuclease Cas1 [Oculatella sp. FACHB-28]
MESLYISQQGCYVSLRQDCVLVKQGKTVLQEAQLPMLEQILVFGQSQLTTQLIRACLFRSIPIAYLSRMGRCHGRVLPVTSGYRALARQQYGLSSEVRLAIAKQIVSAKLKNSRVILQRQQRRHNNPALLEAINQLEQVAQQVQQAASTEQLMGYEGAGAASYFGAFGACIDHPEFVWVGRSKRPPGDPLNAMLSFGYQVLWNHLLSLIEIQGLDPYEACLHQGSERHPALASDLIEVFRSPIVDSLVLYLVNRRMVSVVDDFDFPATGGCYLNESGRKKLLIALIGRMEEQQQVSPGIRVPRWDLLNRQVKRFRQFITQTTQNYEPYRIR